MAILLCFCVLLCDSKLTYTMLSHVKALQCGAMETVIAHVREGNLQEVRLWLDDIENDVNQGDEHRFSLLHWAAREGRLAVVDLLVMRGARVNATNMGDDTALHLAASHGHIDVVHFLLKCHRFNVDVANEHGNTPLHYACFWNHLEISEHLIKNGASLMQENKYGETPLEIARPRAAALLAPLAEALGHDLSRRKPFRDTSWIGTKTRARDATLYRLDGESWDPREVELTGALADGHGAEVLKGSFRRCPVVVKMLKLRNCTIRQVSFSQYFCMSEERRFAFVSICSFTNVLVSKAILVNSASPPQARDFKEEFPRLRIFNHPNILPVLAIFTATPRLCLVSDYMQYGSLYDVLHQPNEPNVDGTVMGVEISQRQALRFAVDIAKAMEYLHSPELKVPNFRLNSKHVMVDEDIAKVGLVDFDGKENAGDSQAYRDEFLVARLDMADYKFSFHEKAREYNPAWMSPE
ncbi:ankyrin repeat protein, partial [Opisthorchis viverrini]